MKYGYEEIRQIFPWDLQSLCMKRKWYTCGDNDEYDHLLYDLAGNKDNITTDDIVEIASDIIEHSELSAADFERVAGEVANIAHVCIFKLEVW